MIPRMKAPVWLAVLVGIVAYVLLAYLRKSLASGAGSVSLVGQSLDISLLYLVCLVPGFLAAALNAGRWWLIGGVTGYLAEVVRVLAGVALQAAGHPDAPSLSEPFVASLIHAFPSVIFGVAGAAIARVPISRG